MMIRTIAVGIIRNTRRVIFIARRPADVHLGGFWEFLDGKVESGEPPEQALYRELREETAIDVEHAQLTADRSARGDSG